MKEELDYIVVRGAKANNLKKVDVKIPVNKLNVITGLSGSGKSSLAFDTLFAEGQRRYIESLSSYARQFLGKIEKPAVDSITGISPAIAIEQKNKSGNPHSTVGTMTEIHDYLKLLYARIGITYSPISGNKVKASSVEDVLKEILSQEKDSTVEVYAQYVFNNAIETNQMDVLLQKGFSRIKYKGKIYNIEDIEHQIPENTIVQIVVDRFQINSETLNNRGRISDSIATAFYEGDGYLSIAINKNGTTNIFNYSNRFEMDGISFIPPSIKLFSFNNPYGACPTCEGFGHIIAIDKDLVIPNKNLSIYEDAISCWRGNKLSIWKKRLLLNADKFDFPIHKPFNELTEDQQNLLWTGNKYFKGLNSFFKHVEKKSYKIQYRVLLARYRGHTICPDCNGKRLRKEAEYVKINNKSINDILAMQIDEALHFFNNISLSEYELKVVEQILIEIKNRLQFLVNAGLSYITLSRKTSTLSGGEFQRVSLANSIGNNLSETIYILDEPSVGLHPKDINRLLLILKELRDLGNTVIVVEHEEEIINNADYLIDLGPEAGVLGGEIMYQGNLDGFKKGAKNSLTSKYLSGREKIELPSSRRTWKKSIKIVGATHNNLKSIEVNFPLGVMTVVCGVSGSGKSSLVIDVLSKGLINALKISSIKPGKFLKLEGDIGLISNIEIIDQSPLGKSSRSNPVTYLKAFDDIRELFARQQLSKIYGYKPSKFSFNVEGGRCDTCRGEGEIIVEMQFMADVHLQCDVCKGKRYKEDILAVEYKGKNISDILNMSIDEALSFFASSSHENSLLKRICHKLLPLQEVGLGYLPIGQSSSTLSGGESQRVKLASFLLKKSKSGKQIFIFDEPTTGLHFHDIHKLILAFNKLIEQGHTLIIIEHNPEIIKSADWLIELGPGGGKDGGRLLYQGVPEGLKKATNSVTAEYVMHKL